MKKILFIVLALSLIFSGKAGAIGEVPENCVSADAEAHTKTTAYNWYCMRTKDHSQPKLDSLLSFTDSTEAYYIDKNNSDYLAKDKVIYLTFDAGYENGNIENILDTLKEKNIKAAFFVLENLIRKNPELIKRMYDEGHLICNHTATHKDMSQINDKNEFARELLRLEEAAENAAGIKISPYYRPPEGRYTEKNIELASEMGYKTIFWSFAYADWDNEKQPSAEEAIEKIMNGLHNGEVLLLHPTSKTNAEILPTLIDRLTEEGFSFKSLDELTK